MRDVDYRYLVGEGIWLALAFLMLESLDVCRDVGLALKRGARLLRDHAKLWLKCRRQQLRAARS